MDLEDWRGKIDDVDQQILHLLNKRAQFSIEIGKIKKQRELPIHSPEREKAILMRMADQNAGPLSDEAVRRVFERVIDESRKLEKDILENRGQSKEG
ncbi:chorismate mutase [candidate division KSB1 bacterium]|nr:chorismate mutase [candidate division KSB1 bacterium]NIR68942.1 chorismate mutase [candidate division KSB1 bacterium]NIS27279.1 chorismate mutase [candidate division KSB1 bacterium]NIT74158.1 chorismate mutase [candidate division KSB1 bacterium]NIU28009.1 chorismate mutase [candidate division KSB1 bacterium]